MIELSEQQIIEHLAKRLADIHVDLEPDEVVRVVHEEYGRFVGRPIRAFVPLFVERSSSERLVKLVSERLASSSKLSARIGGELAVEPTEHPVDLANLVAPVAKTTTQGTQLPQVARRDGPLKFLPVLE